MPAGDQSRLRTTPQLGSNPVASRPDCITLAWHSHCNDIALSDRFDPGTFLQSVRRRLLLTLLPTLSKRSWSAVVPCLGFNSGPVVTPSDEAEFIFASC